MSVGTVSSSGGLTRVGSGSGSPRLFFVHFLWLYTRGPCSLAACQPGPSQPTEALSDPCHCGLLHIPTHALNLFTQEACGPSEGLTWLDQPLPGLPLTNLKPSDLGRLCKIPSHNLISIFTLGGEGYTGRVHRGWGS